MILGTLAAIFAWLLSAAPAPSWLDEPLAAWNTPGRPVPAAPRLKESREDTTTRCRLTVLRSTPGELEVAAAGWIAFHHLDRQLLRDEVEIIGGMAAADETCRPMTYNLFVFVGGRFAGALSPAPMSSRLDASSGAVRLTAPDRITADFSRYNNADTPCCPSSHIVVRYTIDRSGPHPVVVPIERRARP